MSTLRYTGKKLRVLTPAGKEILKPYIPDDDLVKAVNLALLLKKPLLLMGEPGCGKSLLAKALAHELYNEKFDYWYQDLYGEWNIKSTSTVKEGLYEIDYLKRLHDAQFSGYDNKNNGNENENNKDREKVKDLKNYIKYGPLDKAFKGSVSETQRMVLLIDEIDKADIDFPNDLLLELDRYEYKIIELENEPSVRAPYPPIIIITSNSEKDLPDAFLRRCLFHYIKPLSKEKLAEIVERRFYNNVTNQAEEELIEKALTKFVTIREKIQKEILTIGKNVSTSEFLDWFEALKVYSELPVEDKDKEEVKMLLKDVELLDNQDLAVVPFGNLLFKNLNALLNFNTEKPAV